MSKFNKYIKQAEKAAQQAIEKYNAAEAAFQQATQKNEGYAHESISG